jgi:SnoaL-like domain
MSDPATHKLAINDLLTCFFQAFDDKNWWLMRDCLCDEVFTDYSSFRNVPPSTISRDQFVQHRRAALQALDMQHNFCNLRVEVFAGAVAAAARCNYTIHRFHPSFDGISPHSFHSCGHYVFAFAHVNGRWRISRIAQHLLRDHGNREIHGATRSQEKRDPVVSVS